MKRERKNKKPKVFKYKFFIKNGKIIEAKNKDEIQGTELPDEYSEIYSFLLSRKEYLMQDKDKNEEALKELNIYFNHLNTLIFTL